MNTALLAAEIRTEVGLLSALRELETAGTVRYSRGTYELVRNVTSIEDLVLRHVDNPKPKPTPVDLAVYTPSHEPQPAATPAPVTTQPAPRKVTAMPKAAAPTEQACNKCDAVKPLSDFYKGRRTCKACVLTAMRGGKPARKPTPVAKPKPTKKPKVAPVPVADRPLNGSCVARVVEVTPGMVLDQLKARRNQLDAAIAALEAVL